MSAGTIADLMRQKGRVAADAVRGSGEAAAAARLVSGNAWGNAIQNISQTVSGSLRDLAQQRADAPQQQAAAKLRQRQSDVLAAELKGMETAQAQQRIGQLAEMVKASGYDPGTAEPIFRAIGELSPDYKEPLLRSLMEPERLRSVTDTLLTQVPGYKAPGLMQVDPTKDVLNEGTGEVVRAGVPAAVPPPATIDAAILAADRAGNAQEVERLMGIKRQSAEATRPPVEPRAPQPTEWSVLLEAAGGDAKKALALRTQQSAAGRAPMAQPDQQFVIRNGQVTPITKGSAQPGDVPYSADAMQGMGGEASDVRSSRAAAALNSIDKLKELAPKRMPGLPGMIEGAGAKVAGLAGYNTGARQYEALLQPTAMQMAVAIQGAAGLSNSEREAMAKMLGNIATMDYETQLALLENASQMIRDGADVSLVPVKDPKTGKTREQWVPKRSRPQGGVAVGDPTQTFTAPSKSDPVDALIKKYGGG